MMSGRTEYKHQSRTNILRPMRSIELCLARESVQKVVDFGRNNIIITYNFYAILLQNILNGVQFFRAEFRSVDDLDIIFDLFNFACAD